MSQASGLPYRAGQVNFATLTLLPLRATIVLQKEDVMEGKGSEDLVAKRLRTGEIAIWDGAARQITLVPSPKDRATTPVTVLRGAEFIALQEALGPVVVLG